MSNYSENTKNKLDKTFKIYLDSLDRKENFELCYVRHKDYLAAGKKLPFSKEDFHKTFKAKDFFKDLFDCGSWLVFRNYIKSDITKLHNGNFCKRDKLCPACAVRRAHKQQVKFMKILEVDQSLKDLDWYYIVIPVKHNKKESFETVFARVESVRRKLVKSLNNGKKGKSSNFWTQFRGGMYSTESTNTVNGWNNHLNLIISAPKGTKIVLNRHNQASALEEWLKVNADGSYVHDIQKLDFDNIDQIRAALVEVLKYSLKFSSLTNQQLLEVFIKTKGKRLFGTFGNMYGKGIEEVELEGDIELDEDFVELIFRRSGFNRLGLKYELFSETKKKDLK